MLVNMARAVNIDEYVTIAGYFYYHSYDEDGKFVIENKLVKLEPCLNFYGDNPYLSKFF